MLPEAIKPCLQGVIPSWIVTSDANGVPNATVISQVHYVDPNHVAVSNQFFSKTVQNLSVNPRASIQVLSPSDCSMWLIEATFVRRETGGPLFESMDMQLQAIASMMGLEDLFKLRSADVCRVDSVREVPEAQNPE